MVFNKLQALIPYKVILKYYTKAIAVEYLFTKGYRGKIEMGRFMGNEPPRIEESVKG
jgi:hypothetical protein